MSELLVRGGAKSLTLSDLDFVEPGNICRSKYLLSDVNSLKPIALANTLWSISPYVQIEFLPNILKVLSNQCELYEKTRKELNQFDWIINCSTDMELAYMLDQMNIKARVFDFSISNDAKEFVAVTGSSIVSRKNRFYNDLDSKEADFYEGAGCFSPTFKASYVDISALLQFAMKNINYRLENNIQMTSFIIRTKETQKGTIEFNLQTD